MVSGYTTNSKSLSSKTAKEEYVREVVSVGRMLQQMVLFTPTKLLPTVVVVVE
jgi:hypothetical protein